LPLTTYRSALNRLPAHLTILHDAGRALFGAAGVFAVRLVSVKSIDDRQIGVCDGGIAHCFALGQTEAVIKRHRRGELLQPAAANNAVEPIAIELFGNSCSRADRIGEVLCVEQPAAGDVVVFEQCGAYHTYSPTGFLNLKPATHYVVS
jgi:diaminopimelate decarboxylase